MGLIIIWTIQEISLKKHITPNPENNEMPLTIEKEFKYSGKVNVIKNLIISTSINKELNYGKYNLIRNKVYFAYNAVRNEFSKEKFGKTLQELIESDDESDTAKWIELKEIFPIRYTEFINEI